MGRGAIKHKSHYRTLALLSQAHGWPSVGLLQRPIMPVMFNCARAEPRVFPIIFRMHLALVMVSFSLGPPRPTPRPHAPRHRAEDDRSGFAAVKAPDHPSQPPTMAAGVQ